jgi:hypothetical protein
LSAVASKSKGASLNFVTAIVDSELEAAAAQLLYSHGNNIIFRALTFISLESFLTEEKSKFQVIYSSDFVSASSITKLIAIYPQIKFTKISHNFDGATFLAELSQSERQPLLRKQERHPNLISVTGGFGSPGCSTVTNQIAARFTDATILYSSRNNSRPQSSSINKKSEVSENNLGSLVLPTEKIFLDAGATAALTTTISDRRFSGQLLNWALNSSAKLIYVIKPDEGGIQSLSNFLVDYQNLITPPPLLILLNQQRFNSQARIFNSQFSALLSGQDNFQIPFDHAAAAKYPTGKQWWANTFSKQFDLIAKSLV